MYLKNDYKHINLQIEETKNVCIIYKKKLCKNEEHITCI